MAFQDGPRHDITSMLYLYKVFCNITVLWTGLIHHLHTQSMLKCVCVILAKSGLLPEVKTMLGDNGGQRWSGSCCHIHVASIQIVLYHCGDVDQPAIPLAHPFHPRVPLPRFEPKNLGYCQMCLGCISAFWPILDYFQRCRLYWMAVLFQYDQSHDFKTIFHPYKVLCNLVVMWIGMLYPRYTNSSPECSGPGLNQIIWAING